MAPDLAVPSVSARLAWSRTYLKGMGLLDNSTRGVWAVTELGRSVSEEETERLHAEFRRRLREDRRRRSAAPEEQLLDESATAGDDDRDAWKERLLQTLLAMDPAAFERLAQRLLRAAGFVNTNVTGRSGDGGIDGMGTYRVSLVSFPVFFQCKRYRGTVGPDKIRDFRGAIAGRGDRGLLITTGTFTRDARLEAARDGATPLIDLIEGERLCELLKHHGLGVTTTLRTIEDVAISQAFFDDL